MAAGTAFTISMKNAFQQDAGFRVRRAARSIPGRRENARPPSVTS